MEDVVAGNPLARDLDDVLTEMGALWEELRGARLFITGGTGFFGCWLLETFLWANDHLQLGASVVVLTRDAKAFANKWVIVHDKDLVTSGDSVVVFWFHVESFNPHLIYI